MNNQFVFEGRMKTLYMAMMAIGVVCLAMTYFMDTQPFHVRFWSNFLHNSVFFTGISFMAMFALSAFITAWAGWFSVIKRLFEAYSLFMLVGLVLMTIITLGVWLHWHHLYHWADASTLDPTSPNYDEILVGKSSFLNPVWYTVGGLGFLAVWYLFARRVRSLSIAEDNDDTGLEYTYHKKMRVATAGFLPFAGFTACAVVWLWVMSVDSHWYSTLFAWHNMVSWFVSFLAFTILTIIYLKGKGYLENVTTEHLHDLGKYMFAFSIFWTYMWFSQYMLIWYANVGEETIYFRERLDNYPVLFYGNLIINFVLPFLVLMRNSTKRKYGTLIFVSILLIFGHWVDFFLMLKPGTLKTAHHDHVPEGFISGFTLPGFLEIGTGIGFLGLFLYVFFHHLSSAALQPKHDPYMMESVTHHT